MELALYHHPFGYYSRGFPAGTDYITAPRVSAVFGRLMGRFVAGLHEMTGGEDVLPVLELGAGDGRLAMTAVSSGHLSSLVSSGRVTWIAADPGYRERGSACRGSFHPLASRSLESFAGIGRAVVVGNEFFDALPVKVVEFRGGRFREVLVGLHKGRLAEDLGEPSGERLAAYLAQAGLPRVEGARYEVNLRAREVMEDLSRAVSTGVLVAVDYGGESAELHARGPTGGTLRSFGSHSVMGSVLENTGETDITADVNFTDLVRWGEDSGWRKVALVTQHRFLHSLGLLEEVSSLAADLDGREALQEYLAAKRFLLADGLQAGYKVLILVRGLSVETGESIRRLAEGPSPPDSGRP